MSTWSGDRYRSRYTGGRATKVPTDGGREREITTTTTGALMTRRTVAAQHWVRLGHEVPEAVLVGRVLHRDAEGLLEPKEGGRLGFACGQSSTLGCGLRARRGLARSGPYASRSTVSGRDLRRGGGTPSRLPLRVRSRVVGVLSRSESRSSRRLRGMDATPLSLSCEDRGGRATRAALLSAGALFGRMLNGSGSVRVNLEPADRGVSWLRRPNAAQAQTLDAVSGSDAPCRAPRWQAGGRTR